MMQRFAMLLLGVLLLTHPAHASMLHASSGPQQPTFTGLCDALSGGCVAAHSCAYAMTNAYSGPLCQLIRVSDGTTINITQTSGHFANTTGVPSFCKGTLCYVMTLYDQIGHFNISAFTGSGSGYTPICTAQPWTCAALYALDPYNGLPIVPTIYGVWYIQDVYNTAIAGGTNPVSVLFTGRNDEFGTIGGAYGPTHRVTDGDIAGTMFMIAFGWDNTSPFYTLGNSLGLGIDEEWASSPVDIFPYGTTQQYIISTVEWGGSTNNIITGYTNGTQIFSQAPINTLNVKTAMHIGAGGDGYHDAALFQGGAVLNRTLTTGEQASLAALAPTFNPSSPAACQNVGDVGYMFSDQSSLTINQPVSLAVLSWGLVQSGAAYTGPIADLWDATGTLQTFGPAATGCGIDPAAATFCGANPPCSVRTLYNQTLYQSDPHASGNAPDPNFNLIAVSQVTAPTVTFSSLNGQATMHFNGSQELCDGSTAISYIYGATLWGTVARQTTPGSLTYAMGQTTSNTYLVGFSAANTALIDINNNNVTAAAADNHWHSLAFEYVDAPSDTSTLYIDGVTEGNTPNNAFIKGQVCLGGKPGGGNYLTGDIAYAYVISNEMLTSGARQSVSQEAKVFNLLEVLWGALPN